MRIELENVSYIYSQGLPYETKALTDISFVCEEGEFVSLIGCTGSGKTTLVEQICGLSKPSSGKVLADGIDINEKNQKAKELKRQIGIVFQYPEYQLFEETVLKDVMFGPKNIGIDDEECELRAREALRLVGLDVDEVAEKSPFALSGGQKRRVAIAGVLAMQPKVLILDEPTAGLDPKGHNDIFDMILNIKKEKGLTVILVSHDMNDVARLADKVVVLKRGKIVTIGSPKTIFSDREKVDKAGLSLPSGALLLEKIRERGFDVNINMLNVEETADEIVRVFKK